MTGANAFAAGIITFAGATVLNERISVTAALFAAQNAARFSGYRQVFTDSIREPKACPCSTAGSASLPVVPIS